jgi:hypothetical protein
LRLLVKWKRPSHIHILYSNFASLTNTLNFYFLPWYYMIMDEHHELIYARWSLLWNGQIIDNLSKRV